MLSSIRKEKKIDVFREIWFLACLIFCIVSFFIFAFQEKWLKAWMSAISIAYVFIPLLLQWLLKFRIHTTLYFFVMLYTVCPLLGYSYDLYHITTWWDKLMHGFAGIIFAMFGAFLPKFFNKGRPCSFVLCAAFGLFFSIAIAGLWEFIEYGMDSLFHTDMQKDRFLDALNSYLLGGKVGEIGVINEIQSVIVNGEIQKGYIDIGLIHTMQDMIWETVGAVTYTIIYLSTKGQRFSLVSSERTIDRPLPLSGDSDNENE